jgi:hypothetical protein
MTKRDRDEVIVDSMHGRLGENFRVEVIELNFMATCVQGMADDARSPMEWICRDKEEGQSTCVALTKLASKHKIDLLVLGSFGRKGERL